MAGSKTGWKTYERKIAKLLGQWFCGDPTKFGRTPCSGGYATRHKRAAADVFALDQDVADRWPFIVEVKYRRGWDLADLLRGLRGNPGTDIMAWFEQAAGSAKQACKLPFLIWRGINTGANYAMMDDYWFEKLVSFPETTQRYFVLHDGTKRYRIFDLDEFTKVVSAVGVARHWQECKSQTEIVITTGGKV